MDDHATRKNLAAGIRLSLLVLVPEWGRTQLTGHGMRPTFRSVAAIPDGVLQDVLAFRGRAPQTDDLTLVILKRTP